jgi:hypothetical protein
MMSWKWLGLSPNKEIRCISHFKKGNSEQIKKLFTQKLFLLQIVSHKDLDCVLLKHHGRASELIAAAI